MSMLIVGVSGLFVSACRTEVVVPERGPRTGDDPSLVGPSRSIVPLHAPADLPPAMVALGRRLFHDTRLSSDRTLSCASCHDLASGGADGLRVSRGVGGREGRRNAPTVFNTWLNVALLWDGRSPTLEAQIEGPVHAENELGTDWPTILARLRRDRDLARALAAAYGDGAITADRVRGAIAAFERSLVTVDSPLDRFLRGDAAAISDRGRRGYELFVDLGCAACHQGANVGGNMFELVGVVVPLEPDEMEDPGRFEVTGDPRDRYVFRVPGLRLAAITPPYFHDGRIDTLEEAIREMAWHQLGRRLADDQVALIVEFLTTLPGEYEGRALCGTRCR